MFAAYVCLYVLCDETVLLVRKKYMRERAVAIRYVLERLVDGSIAHK